MRAPWIAALVASGAAFAACSLITTLDDPRDAGLGDSGVGSLCTPEVIVDLGADAGITSLYVDEVGGKAYFGAAESGNVYAVALDAGVGTTPDTVMTGLPSPERIAGTEDKPGNAYVYVAATGRGVGSGGIYVLLPDGGVRSAVDAGSPIHAYGIATQGIFPPNLFWTSCAQPSCNTGQAQVLETALTTGTTTTLATNGVGARDLVLTDQGTVWWVDTTATLFAVATNGAQRNFGCGGVLAYASSTQPRVYFTTTAPCSGKDVIQSIAADDPDASPSIFDDNASGLVAGPSSLAFDRNQYLYWVNLGAGTVARKDTTSDAGDEMVAVSPGVPRQIVWIPPGVLYWTTDSGLVRCAL